MKSEESQDMKNELKCTYCDKQFKYDSERRRHEQSHTPQFECKVCMKKFSFISALRRHEKQHERKGSVVCSECSRKFRDEILLKRHIQYAHKGTFTCTKCKATFNSDTALRAHMKTHKPASERRFRCSVEGCNKSFNFTHHLKHHEMTHTDTKQHFCKVCGKGFIQSHHLKTHLKSHDPKDWLQCTITNCTKKFATEYARKRHISTHKTKMDSGISSDSSSTCDLNDSETKGKVSTSDCPVTCQDNENDTDIVGTEVNLTKHINNDILDCPVTRQDMDNLQTNEMNLIEQSNASVDVSISPMKFGIDNIVKHLNSPVKPNSEYSNEEGNVEESFRSCKTVLGGCIMSRNGEENDNCLCAQISCNSTDEDYVLTPNNGNSRFKNADVTKTADSSTKSKTNEIIADIESNINMCVGCECAGNVDNDTMTAQVTTTKCTNASSYITNDTATMPELEHRTDGIIKIKETFDFDIEMNSDGKVEDDFDKALFPFNSCKSVLGKCIVSGNGTIGEGCFCAKMALEENSANAEEIEELTPCPIVI